MSSRISSFPSSPSEFFILVPLRYNFFFPSISLSSQRLSLGTRVAFTEASRSNAEWWRDGNRGEPRCSDTSLQRLLLLLPPRYFSFDLNSVTFDAAWRTLRKSQKKMKVEAFSFPFPSLIESRFNSSNESMSHSATVVVFRREGEAQKGLAVGGKERVGT